MEKITDPLFGFYRAKIVDNKDKEKYGRVLLWIPDIMPLVDDKKGLWARPANNPVGGRNMEEDSEHHYMGTSYIPKIGSWVFVFFECGNINRPYYFGSLDLENTKVLPENQKGTNYEDKWTVIKTHFGRCIVVSDDPDDERVEITGKKRELKEPPTGDLDSVYTIDGNQTTILLDERSGKQKLLIRTYKGDFLHIDIDSRKLQAYFKDDIIIKTDGKFDLHAKEDIRIKTDANYNEEAIGNIQKKSGGSTYHSAGGVFDAQAGNTINFDAQAVWENSGMSSPANPSSPEDPEGGRDT
jgi:hypothetical protein